MSHRQVRAWHAQHASTRGNVAKKTSTTTSAETGNSSSKIITSIATFKCNQRLCSNISRNIAYVAPQQSHPILAATLCYAATATEAGEFNI